MVCDACLPGCVPACIACIGLLLLLLLLCVWDSCFLGVCLSSCKFWNIILRSRYSMEMGFYLNIENLIRKKKIDRSLMRSLVYMNLCRSNRSNKRMKMIWMNEQLYSIYLLWQIKKCLIKAMEFCVFSLQIIDMRSINSRPNELTHLIPLKIDSFFSLSKYSYKESSSNSCLCNWKKKKYCNLTRPLLKIFHFRIPFYPYTFTLYLSLCLSF